MPIYGYARVSTQHQSLDFQRDALRRAGCIQIFEDIGELDSVATCPNFFALFDSLVAEDVVIVCKLNQIFMSPQHALQAVEALKHKGAHLQSLDNSIEASELESSLRILSAFPTLMEE